MIRRILNVILFSDRPPMQGFQDRCYIFVFPCSGDKTSGFVLYSLYDILFQA